MSRNSDEETTQGELTDMFDDNNDEDVDIELSNDVDNGGESEVDESDEEFEVNPVDDFDEIIEQIDC